MKTMKRILCAALSICLALCLCVNAGAEGVTFVPGTYTSIVDGRNGPVVIQMDFSETEILDVRVITHNETYLTGNVPLELYAKQVVEHQSVAVDIVAGATISSAAFLTAAYDCVKQAGANPQDLLFMILLLNHLQQLSGNKTHHLIENF